MDTALAQLHDRLSVLEQENALLRSRLQSCEHSYALLQLSVSNFSEHRLLEATAQVASALLTISPLDQAVNTALQIIGESLETDRVAVIENSVPSFNSASTGWKVLYEWTSPHTTPQISHPDLSQGTWEGIEEWYERLSQNQSISCLLEEMPEPFRSGQAELGLKALYAVPIFVEDKYWGVIGFDDCREAKRRSPAELSVLKIAADCIGSAIQRDRTQQAILEAEQARSTELEKVNKALKRTVDVLAIETDLDRFLGQVLRVIADQLEAPLAEYWYHPEPANLAYVGLTYWQGQILKPEEQPGHVGSFGYPVPAEMIQQESLHHRRSHFITEDMVTSSHLSQIAHESGLDAGAWYGSRGVSSALNVPLILGDKTIGALIVFFSGSRPFTEPQIELAYALAQQVTLAIQLTQLAEEAKQTAIAREQKQAAQHQAAELARANTLLRNSLSDLSTNPNLNDILGHLLVEVVRYSGASVGHIFSYDADQNTLNLTIRCQDEQHFFTPADDEPILFQSPISVERTLIFSQLCEQPRLAVLNQEDFEGRLWQDVSEWFQSRGYQGTSTCVLMVGDRPLGLLAMAFPQPVAFSSVEEELVLALAQQIALVLQITILGEADKQAALAKLNEVLAREGEIAALEQVAELAKANASLRRSVTHLSSTDSLHSFLVAALQGAIQSSRAATGAIFLYHSASHTLQMVALVLHGEVIDIATDPRAELWRPPMPADLTQILQMMQDPYHQVIWFTQDQPLSETWQFSRPWHQQHGHKTVSMIPLAIGEQVLGFMGLAFTTDKPPSEFRFEQCRSFAHHAALAIQMAQLAEQAKDAALLEERNRMASEIHDTLAQAFTGISLQIEVVKSLVHEESQTIQQILKHISQLAESGLSEARRSVWALYPLAAEYADLAQLLYESVEQMTRNTSIAVDVNVQGSPYSLPPFIGMNLLRIGQEAVTNALKHAQADTIAIELVYDSDRISLTIYDNGRGFTPPTTLDNINGGFGLISMYERCDRIGAQLSLSSQPGQGTQILVEAPLG
jgi:signal transduction histidine kinase